MFMDKELVTGKPLIYSIDYASITPTPDLSCDYIGEKAVLMDYPLEYKEGMEVMISGACNGPICFCISIDAKTSICIWNPTTREYKESQYNDFHSNPKDFCDAGFGYDSKTGEYKVVIISTYYEKPDYCECEVYTFGSHLSKTIHTFPCKSPIVIFCCVFLNGSPHWTRSTPEKYTSNCIISFDISNKKLMDVPLPEKSIIRPEDSNADPCMRVAVLGDCLSLVLFDKMVNRVEVCVMQDYGVRESWTELFTTAQKQITYYAYMSMPMLSLKTGENLMYTFDGFVLFDPKNERVGNVSSLFQKNKFTVCFLMMLIAQPRSYFESLVSLNSGTYVKKRA